jgi:hypothetical protein
MPRSPSNAWHESFYPELWVGYNDIRQYWCIHDINGSSIIPEVVWLGNHRSHDHYHACMFYRLPFVNSVWQKVVPEEACPVSLILDQVQWNKCGGKVYIVAFILTMIYSQDHNPIQFSSPNPAPVQPVIPPPPRQMTAYNSHFLVQSQPQANRECNHLLVITVQLRVFSEHFVTCQPLWCPGKGKEQFFIGDFAQQISLETAVQYTFLQTLKNGLGHILQNWNMFKNHSVAHAGYTQWNNFIKQF